MVNNQRTVNTMKSNADNESEIRWPDFFVVGAPKCGTTSLYHYLKAHPKIFLPDAKEPNYFGSDLIWRERHFDRDDYIDYYKNARADQLSGDMSTLYLISKNAAMEIAQVRPDAKIVVMIRNPMTMIPSLYEQALRTGDEIHLQFKDALEDEGRRRRGEFSFSEQNPGCQQFTYYSEIAKYSDQIKKYMSQFGRPNVHVIVFEDFVTNTREVMKDLYHFLGLNPVFPKKFLRYNQRMTIKNEALWRLTKHPSDGLRKLWRMLFPKWFRSKIIDQASKLYLEQRRRWKPSKDEAALIAELYEGEASALEELLGIDLSSWRA